jgi:prevent-host-death family protein
MPEPKTKAKVSTIAATEARIHFGDVLRRVHNNHEQLIVEKDGLPVAAILSHAEYEEYRRLMAAQLFDELSKAANRMAQAEGYTEEKALADVAKAKKEVFDEQYGHATRARRKKHS